MRRSFVGKTKTPKGNQKKECREPKGEKLSEIFGQCESLLMEALRLKATIKKHTNVLHYMMGYFKKQLTADEKQELLEVINDFYNGLVPHCSGDAL